MSIKAIAMLRRIVPVLCAGATVSAFAATDPFLDTEGKVFPNPVLPIENGWQLTGLLVADFNEDGLDDLAVVHRYGLHVSLGNGDCTFTYPVFTVGGDGVGPGAIADFNEDSHQDIVFASRDYTRVVLGSGDGTFYALTSILTPHSFGYGVAVDDFNGDNDLDILAPAYFSGLDSYYIPGNGDGTFAPAAVISNEWTTNVSVADFNEDGHLDFVAGDDPVVSFGAGNGTFAPGGQYPVGQDPKGLVVFDLDGDSHADFVTANWGSDDISVRLGIGDGTFGAETRYSVGDNPEHLALADADNDGNMDLFVGYPRRAYVSRLAGNGDGTFDPEVRIPTVHLTGPIALADFDNDGSLDLAIASFEWQEVAVLRGHGDGSFAAPDPGFSSVDGPDGFGASANFADINNDGLTDAALLADSTLDDAITILLADGAGSFNESATSSAGNEPTDIAIADLDNDTNPDVITTSLDDNNARILLGNGDGTFAPVFTIPMIASPVSIATGQFDGDANVDLAVIGGSPGPAAVHYYFGDGMAGFSQGSFSPVGEGASAVEIGDFNEDGQVDLVVLNRDSRDLSVLIGLGNGMFQAEARYVLDGTSIPVDSILTVADLNSDGHQDLIVPDDLVVYGFGDGTFSPYRRLNYDGASLIYAVDDVDGDGHADLVGGGSSSQIHLWPGQPDGGFGDITSFAGAGRNPQAMILEDMNADGRLDVLAAADSEDGSVMEVVTLRNIEPAPFNFGGDKMTLRWPDVCGALAYNVYRGQLSSLVDNDIDGLPDAGYGDCENALDPDTTDLEYVDAAIPPIGSGYFYLIAVDDGVGEIWLGTTSDGLPRVPSISCP
jgi:hypothetical protein